MNSSKTLIVLVGPTAIGKTELSIRLAHYFNTEIISADSRQFFREMTIGTAKPSKEELKTVPHHFIDILSISEAYTAGKFEMDAVDRISTLFLTRNTVVCVGGSGLYINALCNGFDDIPSDMKIRLKISTEYKKNGIEWLQNQLKKVDPDYYTIIDVMNPNRLIRALEIYHITGFSNTKQRTTKKKQRNFNSVKIGLNAHRDIVYDRINERVDKMIDAGLIEEVKSLLPFKHLNALKTVGYSELFDYFESKLTLQEAIELIKRNTRRYAKRQLTWFRKDESIAWFEPSQLSEITEYLKTKIY